MLNILEDAEAEKEAAFLEKEKSNAILYSIGDGVFVVDKDLKIIMYNEISAQLSGFSITEAIGQKYDQVLKFIFEKDGIVNDQFINNALTTGKIQEMSNHTLLVRKDGSQLPVADSAAPIKNSASAVTGCVVVFCDVTKEREIDKMKTEFVSVASHQLRTPLTAIRWILEELASGELGTLNGQQRDYLNQSLESSERMMNLVNDLLNVSRLEIDRLSVDPRPTDLIALIKGVIKEYQPIAQSKNCVINFKTPKLKPKNKY
ncbi:MAG TPA: histidine kinase dimerization/phospho-acceptor domain-containing protein [bacterium]|nr:histidine kinase dimerization/phospho-acceptor domain-containing protein [bacterium]HNS33800.1 histidine kinase dimerization/phospho-acceptor domain-containing protein [bacterium]HNZ73343.1 histidine kinase dimerization/phospho-acceptor domain-containing protein [bacterium]HOH66971.1 histidine kinase dimerization/phospho-acceptor domain-containing protein [bacterium]HQA63685.1 histidine kinase dimerization/phospho-acceptor domain-containing protein [bacterium]